MKIIKNVYLPAEYRQENALQAIKKWLLAARQFSKKIIMRLSWESRVKSRKMKQTSGFRFESKFSTT